MTEQPTYEALLAEVMRLRAENAEPKNRLGIPDAPPKRQLSGPERIVLFMSLFSGRQDVYAHRYESKNGQKGYSPACVNEWKQGYLGAVRDAIGGPVCFLFDKRGRSYDVAAATRAAIMYTLIASCKIADVDPSQWMEDALRWLPYYKRDKKTSPSCSPRTGKSPNNSRFDTNRPKVGPTPLHRVLTVILL